MQLPGRFVDVTACNQHFFLNKHTTWYFNADYILILHCTMECLFCIGVCLRCGKKPNSWHVQLKDQNI